MLTGDDSLIFVAQRFNTKTMRTVFYSVIGLGLLMAAAFGYTYLEEMYRKYKYGAVRLINNLTKDRFRMR